VKNPNQDSLALLDMMSCAMPMDGKSPARLPTAVPTEKRRFGNGVHSRADHRARGSGVEVLAEYAGKPALVQKERIMAATFHPELTDDTTVHERFVKMQGSVRGKRSRA